MTTAPAERMIRTDVRAEDAGQRLDLFLSRRFNYQSRHQWQRMIERGHIQLNETHVRPARILNCGDTIAFLPPKVEEPPIDACIKILREDKNLLLIDKSGNLPCHPGGAYFNNTLWQILKPRYGELHIVTRLDRETSGLVLCARTPESARELTSAMAKEQAQKTYYALVVGEFKTPMTAKGFLFKHPTSPVRKKRAYAEVVPKEITAFEACETQLEPVSTSPKCSLVRARPVTGRLHQIRATLCSLGFPLIGDKLYGINDHYYLKFIDDQLSQLDLKMLEMERQALHAAELKIPSTESDAAPRCFTAPLPDDMLRIAQKYKLKIPEGLLS